MPTLFDRIAAGIGLAHARRVYARFLRAAENAEAVQHRLLMDLLKRNADSEFGRRYGFSSIRSTDEFRRNVPIATYEDLRPYIERVMDGDTSALLGSNQRVVMFATSSGTTDKPKYIPVTPRFIREYRSGWNTFGHKVLSDHPQGILRAILQSSGRHDESLTPLGVPCGAITGLLASTQKRIVRRFYVGRPEIARIGDARARYYALMRLAIMRDVGFAITANPATLIQLARIADEESETLIRDVRDGSLSAKIVDDRAIRSVLQDGLRPDAARAAELTRLRHTHDALRPRDYWSPAFLACWIGGSMGHYLDGLRTWYGDVPVRDIGLLASEGRVTIPVQDGTPAGALDVTGGFFEFLTLDEYDDPHATTLLPRELQVGLDYVVVLSNSSGLMRYRLDDVVHVQGRLGAAPILEFRYRAGRVASVAGEKLTENQVVSAISAARQGLGLSDFDFVLAPEWGDPPSYRLSLESCVPAEFASVVDRKLSDQNQEYASRRKSLRLGMLQLRPLPAGRLSRMDADAAASRGGRPEQYKRQFLFTSPGDDDEALGITGSETPADFSEDTHISQ